MLWKFLDIISKSVVVNTFAVFFILTFFTKIFLCAPNIQGAFGTMITFGTGFLLVLLLAVMYLIYKGHNSRIAEFTVSLILALIYLLLSISNVVAIKNIL